MLAGYPLQHDLTHDSGAGPDGGVLKDCLRRLYLIPRGSRDLVDPGGGAHSCASDFLFDLLTRRALVQHACSRMPPLVVIEVAL
jgi:hypothetical protein